MAEVEVLACPEDSDIASEDEGPQMNFGRTINPELKSKISNPFIFLFFHIFITHYFGHGILRPM